MVDPMKRSITATIEKDLIEWIEAESKRKDEFNRSIYRNRSQLVENLIELGKKELQEREKE